VIGSVDLRFVRFERHVLSCEPCVPVYRRQLAWDGKGERPGPLCPEGDGLWKSYLFPPFAPALASAAADPPASPEMPDDLAETLPTCAYCPNAPDEGYVSCGRCRARMLAHHRALRAKRRESGLCVACGKATAALGEWCAGCRRRAMSEYERLRDSPNCASCRKPKEDRARPYCAGCRADANRRRRDQRAAARAARLPADPRMPKPRDNTANSRRLRERRRAMGMCVECGRVECPPGEWCPQCRSKAIGAYERLRDSATCARCKKAKDEPGRPYCAACREEDAARKRAQREAAKGAGLCYGCGKEPPRAGSRRCWTCIDKGNAQSRAGKGAQAAA
jgi:uncharacterized OB-fold protein